MVRPAGTSESLSFSYYSSLLPIFLFLLTGYLHSNKSIFVFISLFLMIVRKGITPILRHEPFGNNNGLI